jgi:hypothetical protein
MRESELVLYYGLSVGAGLAVALIFHAISEYLHNPSNQTNSRTIIHEAGAILEDGRNIRVTARNEPRSGEPLKPFPVAVAAYEQVTVSIFSVSRQDVSVGLASCYVIRDNNKLVTGPVHGQLD